MNSKSLSQRAQLCTKKSVKPLGPKEISGNVTKDSSLERDPIKQIKQKGTPERLAGSPSGGNKGGKVEEKKALGVTVEEIEQKQLSGSEKKRAKRDILIQPVLIDKGSVGLERMQQL